MKTKSLLLLAALGALALGLTGCTTSFANRLNRMPDGRFSSAVLTETGKFTTTTIKLSDGLKDNGELHAGYILISHSNPWVVNFTFEARDYELQLSAAAKRKPFPSSTPVPLAKAVPFAAPEAVTPLAPPPGL